jgi:hypothetical protein
MALPGTRFLCVRNYALNGQWETWIELARDPQHDSTTKSLEHGGGVDTLHTSQKLEVAYGPYMGVLKHMAGAKVCREQILDRSREWQVLIRRTG